MQLFAQLHRLTGEACWAERADAVMRRFAGELARNFVPYSSLIDGALQRAEGLQIVVVGAPRQAQTRALFQAAARAPVAYRTDQRVDPDACPPDGSPAAGRTAPDGTPAVYVCRGPVCQAPKTDAAALSAALAAPPGEAIAEALAEPGAPR